MSRAIPAVSVIIPTHNRRDSVCRTLTALSRQTMDAERFEVIVIADGCADDTAQVLQSRDYPFRLRVIEQPGMGQGKARNIGAQAAAAPILVFLDDDIEPFPGMLSAYEHCHVQHPAHLVLGPAYPVLREERSLFSHGLRNWWSDHIRAIMRPTHRFTYRDMHSGNFSMPAGLFARSGGFDPDFFRRSGEDYEFGMRLMAMEVPFIVATDAGGNHHDATDLARSLVRVRMEGRADVLIGIRHPALRAGSALSDFRSPRNGWIRALRNLAFKTPRTGDVVARMLQWLLRPLEVVRARKKWRKVYGAIRAYWYCRGAAEELAITAGSASLEQFLDGATPPAGTVEPLPLDGGLGEAMRELDRRRPRGVEVRLSGVSLGVIPDIPGAEPVRGTHLAGFFQGDACYRALIGLSIGRIGQGASRRSA